MDLGMKKYKISIALSCYNGAKYLKEQLLSISNQDVLPDEIVIIDDCSVDDTLYIIEDFKQRQTEIDVILVKHETNCGYRKSFFEAIKLTTGDVVFCCDQDDIWHKNKISRSLKLLQRNEKILVLNTNYVLIDSNGKKKKEYSFLSRNRLFHNIDIVNIGLDSVLRYNVSMGCTICFKSYIRNIICDYFDMLMKVELPHDWVINIIGAIKNGTYYSKERLMQYRIHDKNTIGLKRANNRCDRIYDLKKAYFEHLEMKKILHAFDCDISYVDIILRTYELRIECLQKTKKLLYLMNVHKIVSCFTIKSALLDFLLIIKN